MANDDGVPEKAAWVLVTRSHGREVFSFPGGMREPGESDGQTLVREIDEELLTAIDADSHRVSYVDSLVLQALHEAGCCAETGTSPVPD
ncbi:NUDIX domain-containing protein [Nonomuraea rubra]